MMELPEAHVVGEQINRALAGRTIEEIIPNASPHGFAWFHGAPEAYPTLLDGRTIRDAFAAAGYVQVDTGGVTILYGDGINLRLVPHGGKRPAKHQLLLGLDDGSALVATVQMYGGMFAYPDGANDNPYYTVALEKPSPLTDAFDEAYFETILAAAKPTLSAKALLATEQRIPGLGNGVLQDILFLSGIHPQRTVQTLDDALLHTLFTNVKSTLRSMTDEGGRDTEKDLFGKPGGYRTLLSRKTVGFPCPQCGGPIERKAYLGGNVYFCPKCQPLIKG